MSSGLSLHINGAEIVFLVSLAFTFAAALYARRETQIQGASWPSLNKWLIGLSAGTTANSGFIVTGAVGLGYAYGLQWIFLPISWLLGDIVFWSVFPARLNQLGREANAQTLSELLTYKLSGRISNVLSIVAALLMVMFLAVYTSAQWLAGQKFLSGVFDFSGFVSLLLFAFVIIAYSSLGGFRGSIYTDALQAIIRIGGTIIAVVAVSWFAFFDQDLFHRNIAAAGKDFVAVFPNATLISVGGFVLGYAIAAIGFGLGQPQVVTRYLAGSSPAETRSAWWIYIGFVQFTWISMTAFGIILRGVMPGISDPEMGLSIFLNKDIGALLTGLIVADVFATIASTSNGILIAIAQIINRDLLFEVETTDQKIRERHISILTLVVGVITLIISAALPGNVFSIALSAVSMLGAAVAGPVMIKTLRWNHTASSLLCGMLMGVLSAVIWKQMGLGSIFNEAGIGLVSCLLTNLVLSTLTIANAPKL
jgi:sodium/proline symporter